jgi:hypothetical protein
LWITHGISASAYTSRFQNYELERLERLKSNIGDVSSFLSSIAGVLTQGSEEVNLVLEMLDPAKSVSLISERDKTGNTRIPPLVYKNFYTGYADRLFGVSLVDLALLTGSSIPRFLTCAIRIVQQECVDVTANGGDAWRIWTSVLGNVTGVHALRFELEACHGLGYTSILKKYPHQLTPQVPNRRNNRRNKTIPSGTPRLAPPTRNLLHA